MTEEEMKSQRRGEPIVATLHVQQPQLKANYHYFSHSGFTGDIDDLEEDEIENDIGDNDDWMFQTFQKSTLKDKNLKIQLCDELDPLPHHRNGGVQNYLRLSNS